jgi:hypothetical protein
MRASLVITLVLATSLLLFSGVCLGFRFAGDQYTIQNTVPWWSSPRQQRVLREELVRVVEALRKEQVPFMLHGRTLRDAINFGRIAPWRRYATLAVFGNDEKIKNAMKKSHVDCEFQVDHFRCGNVFIVELEKPNESSKILEPDSYYKLFHGHGDLLLDDVYPLKTIYFEGEDLPIPQKPEEVLKTLYGHAWDQKVCFDPEGFKESLMIPYGVCGTMEEAQRIILENAN